MFTTGFKFYFGVGLATAFAAVVYGYSTGGNNVGPVSLGWKGGVGDHLGYTVLVGLATAALLYAFVIVAYRDADPAAQAHLIGVDEIAPTPPVTGSFWPVIGAFGAATAVIGLVLNPAVFGLGLIIMSLVLVEWMMDAWADRATGDREVNRELRNKLMAPVEIPAIGAVIIGVGVLAVSRIFLSVSQLGAVVVAGVLAVLILAGAVLYVFKPGIGRNTLAALAMVGAVGLLAGGIIAAVAGERDFEEHHTEEGEEHSEDGEEHSEDGVEAEADG